MMNSVFLHRSSNVFFTALLVLFFSGFYITKFDSSTFSSVLRIFLVLGFLYFIFVVRKFFSSFGIALREAGTENGKNIYVILFFFFLYAFSLSIFFAEWSVLRRSIILLVFLFVIGGYSFYLRFNYDRLIYVLGVGSFFLGNFYLYNYFSINDFTFAGYRDNPVQGTGLSWLANYDNTITAALHISFICIAAVWSYFNSKNKLVSCFYCFSFFILLMAIVLTFARTAWVAIFFSLLVFFIYELKRNKLKVFYLYGVLLVMGVVYIATFYSTDMARGLTYRDETWVSILSNMESVKDWIFGMGPGASVSFVKLPDGSFSVHAHSIYVETIYRYGLLGLLLFLSLFFLAIRNLIIFSSRSNVFFIAVLCGAGAAMFFDFSNLIYSPNLIWLWVWFPIAVSVISPGNSNVLK